MKTLSKLRFRLSSCLVALLLTTSGIQTVFAVFTPPLTKCHIEVDNPHISKFILRTQKSMAIKVNARSQCNKPMRNLILTVEIYKSGILKDYLVARSFVEIRGMIPSKKIIRNEKTYFECKNSRNSAFYGVAYASANVSGEKLKTFHVISEKTSRFDCGN